MKRLIIGLMLAMFLLVPVSCAPAAVEDEELVGEGRFKLMDDIGPLGAELERQEMGTFAGLWIEHEPEFRVVIAFTENGEETIKKYVEEDSPLADEIELRTFEATYEELKAAQREAGQLLDELGLFVSSDINIKENQAKVYVTDSKLFYKTLQEADAQLPDHVVAIIVYEPLYEIPFDINPDPSVCFPQLKMRSGEFMESLMTGELILEDCYLHVDQELIIWQPDYFVNNNDGVIEILDRNGEAVARVGERVSMGGGEIEPIDYINKLLKEPLPADSKGPYWLMGEIVPID
ncbi:hypothetical protein ES708_00308 [subsurface metagenome]